MRLYTTDSAGNPVQVPSKYVMDEKGYYWEDRGDIGGGNLYVPAPPWAGNINDYLFEGPNIHIETHDKPICDVPGLKRGAAPADDGNLIMTTEEKDELLHTDPLAENFIRPFIMGKDFINRINRWCLWLKGVEPADIRKCPRVLERIERVREFRKKSQKAATRKKADTPTIFDEPVTCSTDYLAIPIVSSSERKYIPMAWLTPDIIAGNKLFVCENATLYHFGVLMSSVHMAWVRCFSGRLRMDYSYSNTLDYNAFPWPDLKPISFIPGEHPYKLRIMETAQAILDARALYPRSSLADLYDERTMPPELRKAHNENLPIREALRRRPTE